MNETVPKFAAGALLLSASVLSGIGEKIISFLLSPDGLKVAGYAVTFVLAKLGWDVGKRARAAKLIELAFDAYYMTEAWAAKQTPKPGSEYKLIHGLGIWTKSVIANGLGKPTPKDEAMFKDFVMRRAVLTSEIAH